MAYKFDLFIMLMVKRRLKMPYKTWHESLDWLFILHEIETRVKTASSHYNLWVTVGNNHNSLDL